MSTFLILSINLCNKHPSHCSSQCTYSFLTLLHSFLPAYLCVYYIPSLKFPFPVGFRFLRISAEVVTIQSLSQIQTCACATPLTVAHQSSLSSTISQRLFKFMSIEAVMLSNHLFSIKLPDCFVFDGACPRHNCLQPGCPHEYFHWVIMKGMSTSLFVSA